jgi:hypothetical protein
MTRDEVKSMLTGIGIKVEELGDRAIEKIQEKVDIEKEQLDTKTRREVRKFWIVVSVVSFFIGAGAGRLFF